ncbi:MAG: recombination-associated protein RdgC [Anaeromyxobacter sp.]
MTGAAVPVMVPPPMPILGGSVTFARFKAGARPRGDVKRWLTQGLRKKAFEPLDPARGDEERAAGFVELEDADATGFGGDTLTGDHLLVAWRVDAVKIPGAAVKAELGRWQQAHEAEKGRPATRGEKAARKDAIRAALRSKTPPVSKTYDLSWNLDTGQVAVWAASRKVVEEIVAALEEALKVELQPCTPGAAATLARLPESALGPTPALVGLGAKEVVRGEG